MTLPLSVLDLSPVGAGMAASQAVRESIELAVEADRLGYTRYWFAEHHNMPTIAASSPEVLIAAAGSRATRIRLGAGGIMVPNHSPLHVIEMFRTLEALFPGRIDLGLGRAPGTDPLTWGALRRGEPIDVNKLLAELLAFEDGRFPDSHRFAKIVAMPADVTGLSIWMLGSTLEGAAIGAQLGVPYAFAGHFAMRHAKDALALYRRNFAPSSRLQRPYAMCAVTVMCGEDDEHAQRLAAPVRVSIARTLTGQPPAIPTIEDALAHQFTAQEQAIVDEFLEGAVIGGPVTVRDGVRALAAELAVDEIMISSLVPGHDERRRALERIATALELSAAH